ncbi:MAG TPA: TonB-dependent receptor [Caldithrix abyssi]|uniref:TonB-dependent receptor n=1 Tax=Caldithrix abyssi TaxID=187145 RepID=A0A7V4U319_CALAY|nr:TonB-dependent receptor [Caldithrix abyssi]
MKVSRLPLLLLFIFVWQSSVLYAQNSGKIAGVITDATTGEPLIGANVVLEGTNLGAATDVDGSYIILRVPPGSYTVSVLYIGYRKVVLQDVKVMTDLTTRLDVQMKPEAYEGEEIVVVAEAPVIRKDLTSVEARMQAEEIKRLPLQELGDVLNMQAGVIRDAGGGIHIRGGRSTEVSYMVNGISITDDFTRSQAFQVENESVQELQVISGTFNAEYGNAMSGVINIVTKTGGSEWQGNLDVWTGDYVSNRTGLFWNIDKVNPGDIYNLQGSFSGPIIPNKLNVFFTGRRYYNDGWLYGKNVYLPQGRMQPVNGDTVAVRGDSSAVPMNYTDRYSAQGSLEWQIIPVLKLRIDALGSREKRRYYDHFFRLNPLGDRGDEELGYSVIGKFTHQLGKLTFQELTYAYKYNEINSRLYEDPYDPRYTHPDSLNTGSFQFAKAGTDLGRYNRYTRSSIFKWDLTSQVTNRHQIKGGVEYQADEIYYDDLTLVPATDANGQQIEPFLPEIRDISTPVHTRATRNPYKFAAYIQDKIEYESLIVNVGLRFDLFNPNGKIPYDPEDPNVYNPFKDIHKYKDINGDGVIDESEKTEDNKYTLAERESFWYNETKPKTQLSPRLGIAFPITESGVIHFSYGIFQQTPDYRLLYVGDQLKVTSAGGTQGPYGNPDLDPQITTQYELGLQQQFTDNLAIDVTGFYKDIRDWITTAAPTPTILAGVSYVRYTNRDFANVRGLTLALKRRYADHFSFSIDYTFQIVEGTNSSPEQEFFSQIGGAEPTRVLTPLDWDQRHTVNATFYVGGESWGTSFISRYNTGQPYTPELVTGTRTGQSILSGLPKNSRNKPSIFNVDISAYKNFQLTDKIGIQVFLRVYNLFDADNPVNVFGDTGEAGFTFRRDRTPQADPGWFDIPSFYSEPRRIQIGTKISFN